MSRAALLAAALAVAAPAMAVESSVSFDSLDGSWSGGASTRLRAFLFTPPGGGPFPAVVGLHGCGGLFNKAGRLVAREAAWAEVLTARGYVVLLPDSFGPRNVAKTCANGNQGPHPWAERSADAYGALLYLQSQSFVSPQRVALMGWSHGGATVIFSVASDNRVRPPGLPQGDFRAAVAFYPGWCDAKNLAFRWTTHIPLLLQVGAADDWTPASPCVEQMREAISRGSAIRIKVHDGAFHDFDWPGMAVHAFAPSAQRWVHVGLDPRAMAEAVVQVPDYLDEFLKR